MNKRLRLIRTSLTRGPGLRGPRDEEIWAEQRPPTNSAALKRALALDPENADAISALAHYNYGSLRWLEAEQLYYRAISIEPDNVGNQRRFGSFLRNTGRTQQALDQLLKARQLGSTNIRLFSDVVNTYAYLGRFAEARAYFEAEQARVGLKGMFGTEAYFVSMLADGMETEARNFATEEVLPATARVRMQFILDRLDGDSEASARLIDATYRRIEEEGVVRWGDIENFLMAGEVELARELLQRTQGYGWSIPQRFILHINEQVDPRYLPYRPNLLLLVDDFPGVPEAFMDIGVDVMARAREKGFIE